MRIRNIFVIFFVIFVVILTSCSLYQPQAGAVPIKVSEIYKQVRDATGATNDQIKIVVSVIGDKGYNDTKTIENLTTEAQINKKSLLFDGIQIGETITIDVTIYVSGNAKYTANATIQVDSENTKVILAIVPVGSATEPSISDPTQGYINIELTKTELSITTKTVTITVDSPSDVLKVKWQKDGSRDAKTLLSSEQATEATKISSNQWSFEVSVNGTYTVAIEDSIGRRETEQIVFDEFDFIYVEGTNTNKNFSNEIISAVFNGRELCIKDFYICDHEVTQGEYELYCKQKSNRATDEYGLGDDYPAYGITWQEAIFYCNKRSLADGLIPCYSIDVNDQVEQNPENWGYISDSTLVKCDFDANGYRLPTEVEWEYAARGGRERINKTPTTFAGSEDINEVAWYCKSGSSSVKTHIVKGKVPNELMLYDMSGNVQEWCWDWYLDIDINTPATGVVLDKEISHKRIIRGGSVWHLESKCTVGARDGYYTQSSVSDNHIGFRVVRSIR